MLLKFQSKIPEKFSGMSSYIKEACYGCSQCFDQNMILRYSEIIYDDHGITIDAEVKLKLIPQILRWKNIKP